MKKIAYTLCIGLMIMILLLGCNTATTTKEGRTMATVTDNVASIRAAILGIDVRESIAGGIEGINTEVVSTTAKEAVLEGQFNSLVINAGSSNAEIVAGRTSSVTAETFDTIGHRIDDVDTQLADNAQYINISTNVTEMQQLITAGKRVYVPDGHYYLTTPIIMPSNSYLELGKNAIMELVAGSNCYMVMNSDQVNGNDNITVKGGKWLGNGAGQTRVFGGTLADSYYGFGFSFYKVTHLTCHDHYFEETNSWAISHMSCNYVDIRNIELNQLIPMAQNGDGVTGSSSNVYIDNVYGFTNDDMVCVAAGGAYMAGNELLYEKISVSNIFISNVKALSRGASNSWKAVAFYSRDGLKLSNVFVKNIHGISSAALIYVGGSTGIGYFDNINISNVDGTSTDEAKAVLMFDTAINISTLNISNMSRVETVGNVAQILIKGDCTIGQLTVNNVNVLWKNEKSAQVILDFGLVSYINLNNIIAFNQNASPVVTPIYRKLTTSSSSLVTHITAQGIQYRNVSSLAEGFVLDNPTTTSKASLKGRDLIVDRTKLTPQKWDYVMDVTNGPSVWNGTAWVAG